MIEIITQIIKDDEKTLPGDRFPLFRVAGKSRNPPMIDAYDLNIDSYDRRLLVRNSFILPELLGICATYQITGKKKICNYSGFLVTEEEFERIAKLLGIYTAVELRSINSIDTLPLKWKKTTFMVRRLLKIMWLF